MATDDPLVARALLEEDKGTIAYRPQLARLTDNVLSAILLQQMIYWFKRSDGEPFYKFRDSCKHAMYRAGDSWCEEMQWTHAEFDGALKVIATKITKGVSKKELLETDYPTRSEDEHLRDYLARYRMALSRVVVYWTDKQRVTRYLVNWTLLCKFINRIYISKSEGVKYLVNSLSAFTKVNPESGFTFFTETTTENTTTKAFASNDAAAAIESLNNTHINAISNKVPDDVEEKPTPVKIDYDALLGAITEVLKVKGEAVRRYASMLMGTAKVGEWKTCAMPKDAPVTGDELRNFGAWWKKHNPSLTVPTKPLTLQSELLKFRDYKPISQHETKKIDRSLFEPMANPADPNLLLQSLKEKS